MTLLILFLSLFWHITVDANNNINGNLEYSTFNGENIEWVWEQRPNSVTRGIVFLAHGCNHHSTDFWPSTVSCDKCIGLPEEQQIVSSLLNNNMLVFAMSSYHNCWDIALDLPRLHYVLQIIFESHKMSASDSPLFCLGASSGGKFCGELPLFNFPYRFNGVIVQISSISVSPSMFNDENEKRYPPSLWMHMTKDTHLTSHLKSVIALLKHYNNIVKIISIPSFPITPTYFSTKIPHISIDASNQLYLALLNNNYLDSNNYLIQDPRTSNWRNVVRSVSNEKLLGYHDSLVADRSPISEVLNVAWGYHEITSDFIKETIDFINAYI
jgi:zinc transporter 2